MLDDLEAVLPCSAKDFLRETCIGDDTEPFSSPDFTFLMEKNYHDEDPAKLLTLKIPEMGLFKDLSKRTMYIACVKTMNYQDLKNKTVNGLQCWGQALPRKVAGGPCTRNPLKREWEICNGELYMGF